MPLLLGYDPSGLDGKLRMVLDEITAAIQVWAGRVDGVNAAERLNELTTGVASLPTVKTGFGQVHFGATLPTGYLWCDGAAVSRTGYANLFTEIGTTYGAGDGTSTFNVPDMRRRLPLGKAASGSASTLGSTGGDFDHTHTGPSHTHGAGTLAGPSHQHSIGASGTHTHGAGSYVTDSAGAHTHDVQGVTGPGDNHSATDLEQVDDNNDGVQSGVMHGNWTNHDHTFNDTSTSDGAHSHGVSGTAGADGDHSHGGSTGSSGTGAVTGLTAAGGTAATGTANPPYLVCNWIIKT